MMMFKRFVKKKVVHSVFNKFYLFITDYSERAYEVKFEIFLAQFDYEVGAIALSGLIQWKL